eukprot:6474893-Amphidinium_carterae.1
MIGHRAKVHAAEDSATASLRSMATNSITSDLNLMCLGQHYVLGTWEGPHLGTGSIDLRSCCTPWLHSCVEDQELLPRGEAAKAFMKAGAELLSIDIHTNSSQQAACVLAWLSALWGECLKKVLGDSNSPPELLTDGVGAQGMPAYAGCM